MTYRGRPSYGCQICRRRKKKCDYTEPTCKNCAKAGWTCPGYRDPHDLLFRDENAKAAKRAKTALRRTRGEKATPRRYPKPDKPEIANHPSDFTQTPQQIAYPEYALASNLDELAIAYFFHYYVIHEQVTYDSWKAVEKERCLFASILALGTAGVTKSGPASSCSPSAQVRYLEAIKLTNNALQSPSDVKKDSILLAVNLLGIFENMTRFQETLEAWHNHIEGAAALLQYRGTEQFETAEGARLFMRTCISLVTSCIGRRCPIPAHIRRMVATAEERIPLPNEKIWLLLLEILRFADLYARLLPDNDLPSTEDAAAIIREALSLDREMARLLKESSDDWYFETIYIDGPTIFDGVMHVDPHFTIVQQYNTIRCQRIIIYDLILKTLRQCVDLETLQLSIEDLYRIHNASVIVSQLQLDILASVPQHLANSHLELNFFSPSSTTSPEGFQRDTMWPNFVIKDRSPWRSMRRQNPPLPFVRMSCTYSIQWALYIAGAADSTHGTIRSWAIKILRLLAHDKGIQQAILLARSLETCEGEQLNVHLKPMFREEDAEAWDAQKEMIPCHPS